MKKNRNKPMKKLPQWPTKTSKTDYLKKLMDDTKKNPVLYRKENNHQIGDYIQHNKFGFGFIQAIMSHTKIQVFFEESEKVMLQNWQHR